MTSPRFLTHFAGGKALAAHSTRTAPVYDPSTGAVAATLPLADTTDIRRVIAALHHRLGVLLAEPEGHAQALELGVDEGSRPREDEQVLRASRLEEAHEIARGMCLPREIEVSLLGLVPDPRDVGGDGQKTQRPDAREACGPGLGRHPEVVHLP